MPEVGETKHPGVVDVMRVYGMLPEKWENQEPVFDWAQFNKVLHELIISCDKRSIDLDPLREEGEVGYCRGRRQALLWVRKYVFGTEEYIPTETP